MNAEGLDDEDVRWADLDCVSAMSVRKESLKEVIIRCRAVGVRVVAAGHLFTAEYESSGMQTIWKRLATKDSQDVGFSNFDYL